MRRHGTGRRCAALVHPMTGRSCCAACLTRRMVAEVRRVRRPGGRVHLWEHLVAESRGLARVQRVRDAAVCTLFEGGCHTAQDAATASTVAGFRDRSTGAVHVAGDAGAFSRRPQILGTATRT